MDFQDSIKADILKVAEFELQEFGELISITPEHYERLLAEAKGAFGKA